MIETPMIYHCRKCESDNIVKNGINRYGSQQYFCKDCKASGVLEPKRHYTEERKEEILRAYQERASMRGIARIFGVSRKTLSNWIKKKVKELPDFKETIETAQTDDVLEIDEIWSFVYAKCNQRWVWVVQCRRTRQVVAFAIGDRSKATCVKLWNKIPQEYKHCHSFSDFWKAYDSVFPSETHQCVGKESGQTCHIERFFNTIRQRLARFVRKTLSFSKSDVWHHMNIKWFFTTYNLSISFTT